MPAAPPAKAPRRWERPPPSSPGAAGPRVAWEVEHRAPESSSSSTALVPRRAGGAPAPAPAAVAPAPAAPAPVRRGVAAVPARPARSGTPSERSGALLPAGTALPRASLRGCRPAPAPPDDAVRAAPAAAARTLQPGALHASAGEPHTCWAADADSAALRRRTRRFRVFRLPSIESIDSTVSTPWPVARPLSR